MCIPSGAHIPQKPEFQFNPILRSTKQADIPPSDGGAPPRPTLTAALLPVQASMPPVRLTVSTFPSHSPHPVSLSLSLSGDASGAPRACPFSGRHIRRRPIRDPRSSGKIHRSSLPASTARSASRFHASRSPRSVLDPTAGAASRGIVPPSCCFGWFPFQIWVLLVRLRWFRRDCASLLFVLVWILVGWES